MTNIDNKKVRVTGVQIAAVISVAVLWGLARWAGWVGYAGADDIFYAHYAWLFDRPPANHWEFRIPAILLIRGSFMLLGPTEFAASLPTLLASLCMLIVVAWFVDWPRTLNWRTQASMFIACVIPIDAAMAAYPNAPFIAAGFVALGTLCFLKGSRAVQYVGALLFAIGFLTHEIMFFYIAIFCFVCLAFDWRRMWGPVAACVALSGLLFTVECSAYYVLIGEPLARYNNAASVVGDFSYDSTRFGGNKFLFFAWPVQILVFCKQFGFDLILLSVFGAFAWRKLDRNQRILLVAMFGFWFWLGYGTQVPWAYRPRSRAFHYYFPLVLGVSALLPEVVYLTWQRRQILAKGLIYAALAVHLACLLGGGRWGQRVDVSRELLAFAKQHPDKVYVADVLTMNEMYVCNGFKFPQNVVCLDADSVRRHLLANKGREPGEQITFEGFEEIDGTMVNYERIESLAEPAFRQELQNHKGETVYRIPVRHRLLLAPFVPLLGKRSFTVRSAGGEVFVARKQKRATQQ